MTGPGPCDTPVVDDASEGHEDAATYTNVSRVAGRTSSAESRGVLSEAEAPEGLRGKGYRVSGYWVRVPGRMPERAAQQGRKVEGSKV